MGRPVSDETTIVGAAFNEALSNPRYFGGRKVIARELARYTHPRAKEGSPLATSQLVDKVLLADGSEVWQCRSCGDTSFEQVLGALSHAAAHNRKRRSTESDEAPDVTPLLPDEDFVKKVTAVTAVKNATVPEERPTRAVLPQDIRGIIRNVTAIKVQLDRMQDALAGCITELSSYTEAYEARVPPIPPEELEELRAKAAKYDQMRGLLS
jgi:hypothetical protein